MEVSQLSVQAHCTGENGFVPPAAFVGRVQNVSERSRVKPVADNLCPLPPSVPQPAEVIFFVIDR
ncbi:MAG: hypothetical protein Kow00106_04330 [Anaerolineae bacterium]